MTKVPSRTETEPNDDDDAHHASDDECTSKPPNSKIRNLVSFQSLSYTDAALSSSTSDLLFAKLMAQYCTFLSYAQDKGMNDLFLLTKLYISILLFEEGATVYNSVFFS